MPSAECSSSCPELLHKAANFPAGHRRWQKKDQAPGTQEVFSAGCPYFKNLFSTRLPTREVSENEIILDSPVDMVMAWRMVLDYLYLGEYRLPEDQMYGQIEYIHIQVYVLALKLCMEHLKNLALPRTAQSLAGLYCDTWYREMDSCRLERCVKLVYGY
ncbi:hypothetical protein FN846DRAFT_923110 [Sphaerosporella brunnea]|uniref:BTB domain-containing protein n=1 Tax=Sphaerosporella brunnea TaxID=1250544 RepID=A0A5J5EFY2_9PEZI|nr:hypothetical protein FN846DRAFT_923110 [Sphaerosporella brunnea]